VQLSCCPTATYVIHITNTDSTFNFPLTAQLVDLCCRSDRPAAEEISALDSSPAYKYPKRLELAPDDQFFSSHEFRCLPPAVAFDPHPNGDKTKSICPDTRQGDVLKRSSKRCIHLRALRAQLLAIRQRKCDAESNSGVDVKQKTGVDVQLSPR
jgi:hypothetical protein